MAVSVAVPVAVGMTDLMRMMMSRSSVSVAVDDLHADLEFDSVTVVVVVTVAVDRERQSTVVAVLDVLQPLHAVYHAMTVAVPSDYDWQRHFALQHYSFDLLGSAGSYGEVYRRPVLE